MRIPLGGTGRAHVGVCACGHVPMECALVASLVQAAIEMRSSRVALSAIEALRHAHMSTCSHEHMKCNLLPGAKPSPRHSARSKHSDMRTRPHAQMST